VAATGGLEHRLKDEDRVKERIAEDIRVKGRTVDEASRAPDSARAEPQLVGRCHGE
jgi:hypothetical protein